MHTALFLLLALVAGSNAMGHGAIHCLEGQASYTDDAILFDGLREKECVNPGETACWSSTMQISSMMNDTTFISYFVNAGCFNPDFEDMYNAGLEAVQQFNNGSSFTVDTYDFNSCNDTDYCNDVRPQGSFETVKCYSGVAVSAYDTEIFSHFEEEQCRVHYTCQSLEGVYMSNGAEYKFTWRGCGDPFKTIYDDQNVLPIVPTSTDPMAREQQCNEIGCFEQVLGLCVCPNGLDLSMFIQDILSFEDKECQGDLCNVVPTHGGGMPDMNYDGMWCMTGERVSMKLPVEGMMGEFWMIITDNAAFTRCPSDYMKCVHYSVQGFTHDHDGNGSAAARLDFGECMEEYQDPDCSPYSTAEGTMSFINVSDCETHVCNESRCNDFGDYIEGQQVELPECRQHVPDASLGMFDIRVLPDCSVSEIFQGVEKCATDFGNQFPYYNQPDMCSMQLDAMVGCMTDLITTCLSSNCPTILDSIPGLRSEFHVVRFFANQIKSVDDVIDTIFMLIPFGSQEEQASIRSMIPDVKQFICMDPNQVSQEIGTIVTDLINDQLLPLIGGSLNLNDIMGPQLADAFFCDADLIEKVTNPVMTLIPSLIGSQSENDACNALVGFANNMIAQVGMSCNFGEVGNFVEYLIGPDSGFPMEVFSFIGMVAPMITQSRLPECTETPDYSPCMSNPCGYQGSCVPTGYDYYYCICMDGSTGPSCGGYGPTPTPGMNPCDSYPCGYDKQCVRTSDYDYYCRDDNDADDVNLNCEQLSCRKHQSLCSYAEWRVSFFGKGLKQLMDHRDKYYPNHTELTVPPCTVTENMIQCKNANMKACHESVIPNCPVCYCMDHKYQNARQVVAMWNGDQHLWANVNRVWMNIMQDKTC